MEYRAAKAESDRVDIADPALRPLNILTLNALRQALVPMLPKPHVWEKPKDAGGKKSGQTK